MKSKCFIGKINYFYTITNANRSVTENRKLIGWNSTERMGKWQDELGCDLNSHRLSKYIKLYLQIYLFLNIQLTFEWTWVSTAWFHLQVNFFNSKYYCTTQSMVGWVHRSRLHRWRPGSITHDLLPCRWSAPLTPTLFKGRLYFLFPTSFISNRLKIVL